ncbi:MAG: hypothetical protein Q9198_009965, partial [Flavoplaca austrocitrina]
PEILMLVLQLFSLTSSIARLSQQINLLGTKRETDRVRERVNDLLEEARSGFKDVGERVKKLTTWEDLNVRDTLRRKSTLSKSCPANSRPLVLSSKPSNGPPSRNNVHPPQLREQQSTAAIQPQPLPIPIMPASNSHRCKSRNNYG